MNCKLLISELPYKISLDKPVEKENAITHLKRSSEFTLFLYYRVALR